MFGKMRSMKGKTVGKVIGTNGVKTDQIVGIPVFGGDRVRVLKLVRDWLGSKDNKVRFVATVNPEHIMAAQMDQSYLKLLKGTSLNVADGIALVWARELRARNLKRETRNKNNTIKLISRLWLGWKIGIEVLRGRYEKEVVAGSSLMDDLAKMAKDMDYRVMYLGGWEDRAMRTAQYFEKKYPGLKVAACRGEPDMTKDEVLSQIRKLEPDILLVAYGMKKQEEWIAKNMDVLAQSSVRLAMGVGRSFDYYSGDLKRAPKGWRKMGLEWLYSLIREPRRWRRQMVLPRFVKKVVIDK